MSESAKATTIHPQPVAQRRDLFGPPPIIRGEKADAFEALLARVRADVKPIDIIEEIWVRDAVELVWEIRRLRRLKVELLRATEHKGL